MDTVRRWWARYWRAGDRRMRALVVAVLALAVFDLLGLLYLALLAVYSASPLDAPPAGLGSSAAAGPTGQGRLSAPDTPGGPATRDEPGEGLEPGTGPALDPGPVPGLQTVARAIEQETAPEPRRAGPGPRPDRRAAQDAAGDAASARVRQPGDEPATTARSRPGEPTRDDAAATQRGESVMTTQEGRDEPAQATDEAAGGERGAQPLSPEQVEEGLNATPNESTPGEATQFGEDGGVVEDGGSVRQSQGEEQ